MKTFTWNLLLALLWVFITESLSPLNFVLGFAIGALVLLLARGILSFPGYPRRIVRVIQFGLFAAKEIVIANLRVAQFVLSPLSRVRPGIIAVELEPLSDGERYMLTSLITLTPGTLSLDLSVDNRVLYVHTMHFEDPETFRAGIKDYERRVLEVTR